VLICEGIAGDRYVLFLFEDICRTEGGIGERRADGGTRVGTGTERGLLTGR